MHEKDITDCWLTSRLRFTQKCFMQDNDMAKFLMCCLPKYPNNICRSIHMYVDLYVCLVCVYVWIFVCLSLCLYVASYACMALHACLSHITPHMRFSTSDSR